MSFNVKIEQSTDEILEAGFCDFHLEPGTVQKATSLNDMPHDILTHYRWDPASNQIQRRDTPIEERGARAAQAAREKRRVEYAALKDDAARMAYLARMLEVT